MIAAVVFYSAVLRSNVRPIRLFGGDDRFLDLA